MPQEAEVNAAAESADSLEAELRALHLNFDILRAQEEIESGGKKCWVNERILI